MVSNLYLSNSSVGDILPMKNEIAMSDQTITLSLPESVYRRARYTAEAARQSVEEVLTAMLAATLPDVEGAPAEMQEELARMTWLVERSLWAIAHSRLPKHQEKRLAALTNLQTQRALVPEEASEIERLRDEYGRVTLRKARAYALLSMRGGRPLLGKN